MYTSTKRFNRHENISLEFYIIYNRHDNYYNTNPSTYYLHCYVKTM